MNEKLNAIAKAVGADCAEKQDLKESLVKGLSPLFSKMFYASNATSYTHKTETSHVKEVHSPKRRKPMLKKIGSSKLQMILVPTIINICLLVGYIFDVQDIQSKVESWTPLINLVVQAVLGVAYAWIEGKVDAAAVKAPFANDNKPYVNGASNMEEPGDTGKAV